MTRLRPLASAALLLLLLGCGEDRVTPLKEEIAKLKKERVPQEQLETAKREAAEAQVTRDAAVARAAEDEQAVEAARAELERLRAALQHEVDRNVELRADIDARLEPLNKAGAAVDALQAQVTERRTHLDVLRDQAKALARAMRPDDPAWAEKRRLQAIADFAREAATQLPNDAAIRALSTALEAPQPDPAALVKSLQAVADSIDHIAHANESVAVQ